MSDAKARHMIYNGKEYKRKEVHFLSRWQDACEGCAFVSDQTACKGSYDQYNLETYCQTKGKSYIFKEANND